MKTSLKNRLIAVLLLICLSIFVLSACSGENAGTGAAAASAEQLDKAAEQQTEEEKKAAEEKAAAEQKAAEQKAAEQKTAEQKAAEEKAAAEQKAAEEKAAAEQKAAEEKAATEQKAAEEKAAAEQKAAEEQAAAEQKAAEEKAAAEQKAAEEKAAAEQQAAEQQAAEQQAAEQQQAEAVAETPLPSEEAVGLDPNWEFAGYSMINSGTATLFRAGGERKGIVVGVNAGHGTEGGSYVYTQCHPDGTPKVTGGSTAEGAYEAMAVASGMTFYDGTPERDVTLREAQILKDLLLSNGYDVLMIRNSEDVQLDNIARTVLCNNCANCHISIHWDGDGLDYDKGCYYMAVPDGLKGMYPVSNIWPENDRLGESLIAGLSNAGCPIMSGGSIQMDLTQTSYSTVPSVDIELGNSASDHSEEALSLRAQGLLSGINMFFGY